MPATKEHAHHWQPSRQTVYYQQKVSETPQPSNTLLRIVDEEPQPPNAATAIDELPHKFLQTEMTGMVKKS